MSTEEQFANNEMIIHLSDLYCLHERYAAITTPGGGSFLILRSLFRDNPPSRGKVGQTARVYVFYCFQWCELSAFTFHKNQTRKGLWDETYSISSFFEKTKKSEHLQMFLQRQQEMHLQLFVGPEYLNGPCFFHRLFTSLLHIPLFLLVFSGIFLNSVKCRQFE